MDLDDRLMDFANQLHHVIAEYLRDHGYRAHLMPANPGADEDAYINIDDFDAIIFFYPTTLELAIDTEYYTYEYANPQFLDQLLERLRWFAYSIKIIPSGYHEMRTKILSYLRVMPRDLFNEAKLLKCLGQLALIIHNHEGRWPLAWEHEDTSEGFKIDQDESSGDLFCTNLRLLIRGRGPIDLSLPYNSKDFYPLRFESGDVCDRVFKEDGTLSRAFLAIL